MWDPGSSCTFKFFSRPALQSFYIESRFAITTVDIKGKRKHGEG